MDLNLVVLCGRLAAPGELRDVGDGERVLRLLVSTRSHAEQRVDVVPVILADPADELVDAVNTADVRVWVFGNVQRRYWQTESGRRSRIEVVAAQVSVATEQEGGGA